MNEMSFVTVSYISAPRHHVMGRSPFYAVSVNCLYRDRVMVRDRDRVSGRVTDRVRFRVRRPDSSGNLLTRRKMDYAPYDVGGNMMNLVNEYHMNKTTPQISPFYGFEKPVVFVVLCFTVNNS